MPSDEIVLVPPKAAQNRLFLRVLARLCVPVVVVAIIIGVFFNVFIAGLYAVLGVAVTTVIVKRRMAAAPTRLILDPTGVRYEEGSFTVEAPWADVAEVGEVQISNGRVPGLILHEGALTWSKSEKIERFAVERGLDKEVPLGEFEADWRTGETGKAVERWAPELLG